MSKKLPIEANQFIKEIADKMPLLYQYTELKLPTGEMVAMPSVVYECRTGRKWHELNPNAAEKNGLPLDADKRYTLPCYKKFNHVKEFKRIWFRYPELETFKKKVIEYVAEIVKLKMDINPDYPVL